MARMGRIKETVRPNPPARIPVVLCLVVFLLSAAVIHLIARIHFGNGQKQQAYTATAWLTERPAASARATGAVEGQPVAISASDLDPLRAVEMANSLADRQAIQRRDQWRSNAAQLIEQARLAAEQATEEYRQHTAQLETYQRQVHEKQAAPPPPSNTVAVPKTLDNPERKVLEQQIAELQQHQAQLLVGRTAAHPAVQEMASKIADLESQLAKLNPTILNPDANEDAGPALNQPLQDPPQGDDQKMAVLTAAVETARQARAAAEEALAQATQHSQGEPQLLVKYAAAPPATANRLWNHLHLLATMFASALMMSVGFGLTWMGRQIQPPVQTSEQLEADLLVPVVGVLASDAPETADVSARIRRRTLMLGLGTVLTLACPIVAIWIVWSL